LDTGKEVEKKEGNAPGDTDHFLHLTGRKGVFFLVKFWVGKKPGGLERARTPARFMS